jgi:hypothetical protein
MYSVESVADVEVRKEQNPQGPWVKKALILALISYLVTQKINQAAIITVVFLVALIFLR